MVITKKNKKKYKGLVPNTGMTNKDKIEYLEELICREKIRMSSLTVIYHPSCGCKIDQFVYLDRYPMSSKIISQCPHCNQGCQMLISDPIIFHLGLTDEDYILEDLEDLIITENSQRPYVQAYINSVLSRE